MLPPLTKRVSDRQSQVELFENPFQLPGGGHIFRAKAEENHAKDHAKLLAQKQKIWKKGRIDIQSSAQRFEEIISDETLLRLSDVAKQEHENATILMPRREEKGNTAEFVAMKREMFLVQMSLDTKREEIRKLEEMAQMKEDALQRSEQMLEEDAMRFDAFLKENDKKTHDAIKWAEEETKCRQEKNQEIKQLTQQIQAINRETSKHHEALEDCLRYKNFLDVLTPPEWFEQHAHNREEKIARLKKEAFDAKYKEWEKQRRRLVEMHRKEVEARKEAAKEKNKKAGYRSSMMQQQKEEEEEPEVKLVIPPPPRLEDEVSACLYYSALMSG
jgi:uncharacterized phage infection (PIP) family protein YhgE